jgi:ABC-type Fe3+-siderophore transport system permease subunit
LLPVVAFVSLSVGTVNFSFFQIIETLLLSMGGHSEPSQIQSIIMEIRLPRLILALLVGAVSGDYWVRCDAGLISQPIG